MKIDWHKLLTQCGVKADVVKRWAPVFAAEVSPTTFSAGVTEVDDFLGQILHESAMLTRVEESLYYTTPERLCSVWPSRFPNLRSAAPFVRNPQALANKVYGGRMGNSELGDGWKFRGRGLLQVTGRDNYAAVGRALGLDLAGNPDLLKSPPVALRASIAWWEGNIPDSVMGDIKRITRRVNGGAVGLEHRQQLSSIAKDALA